jgi:uncharacterized protein (TIGR03435 family)
MNAVDRLGWTLIHFLWQGALIAGLYAIARRRARAPRVRYGIACLTLTIMAAAPVVTWIALAPPAATSAPIHLAVRAHGNAGDLAAGELFYTPDSEHILPWIVLAWLTGATIFSVRLTRSWIAAVRLRSRFVHPAPIQWRATFERLAARLGVSRPVRLLVSAVVQTPAVIGWVRPVVLIPAAALTGLPANQLEALLLHELAHIRRADYLVGILQSAAEALLFYHPAVWWVSHHIRAERELCCDDMAVEATGDVLTYARALANLETFRLSPIYVGANGGSLPGRIARLLGQTPPSPRRPAAPAALAGAMIVAAAVLSVFGQPSARPRFDVASIKPSSEQRFMAIRQLPGGRLTGTAPVRLYVINAFNLAPYQVIGGPGWIDSDRYLIDAKAAGAANRPELMLMLQSLLEERFQLKTHRENRELPVYNLTAGKNGPKVPPPKDTTCIDTAADPCGKIRMAMGASGVHMAGANVTTAELARMLSGALGRSVIDKTGFTGKFDLDLTFAPDMAAAGLPAGAVPAADPNGGPPPAEILNGSIFTAVQEQLGLKLESTKGPVEVLVIDHVERPTEN